MNTDEHRSDRGAGGGGGGLQAGEQGSLLGAVLLILSVLAAKIAYIVLMCPYDLVEDEAHYWLWAQHPDWSYYSKGPGIAWAILISTRVFGDAEWAVRLPTVLAQAIGALACAGLARDVARRALVGDGSVATPARAAVMAAAAYLLVPAFQLTGILVTIDGCYLACWAVACWAAWRALCERGRWAWAVLGAAVAIGFAFKYTMLLLAPGVVVFALLHRGARGEDGLRLDRRWRAWLAGAVVLALMGLAPVVIWNAREGWPTFKHLLGHLGVRGGDMPPPASAERPGGLPIKPLSMLAYVAAPVGMIGPVLIIAVMALKRVLGNRGAAETWPARRVGAWFLFWAFAPIFAFYLAISLFVEVEQNWAIAGFVSLTVLGGWHAADELARRRAGARDPSLTAPPRARTRTTKVLFRLAVIYGLGAAVVLHRGDWVASAMNGLAATGPVRAVFAAISGREPRPIVTGRLIGAEQMSRHAARIVDRLALEKGERQGPFIICEHYGRASQLAYYLTRVVKDGDGRVGGRRVEVFSSQSVMGGRRSQFDLWPEASLARPELIGRDALLLSNDKPTTLARWRAMFESVEPIDAPGGKLEGEHKRDRVAYVGRRFLGVADP